METGVIKPTIYIPHILSSIWEKVNVSAEMTENDKD